MKSSVNSVWMATINKLIAISQSLHKIQQADCHYSQSAWNTTGWLPFFRVCVKYKLIAVFQNLCKIQADCHLPFFRTCAKYNLIAIFQSLCKIQQADCHFSESVRNTASRVPFLRVCAKYSKLILISQGMCEIQSRKLSFFVRPTQVWPLHQLLSHSCHC